MHKYKEDFEDSECFEFLDDYDTIDKEHNIQDKASDLYARVKRDAPQEYTDFYEDLVSIITKYNQTRHSNTPSYLLAQYMLDSLETFEKTVNRRDIWWEHFPKYTEGA